MVTTNHGTATNLSVTHLESATIRLCHSPSDLKTWQAPPALPCFSRTRTLRPALASNAAAVNPPIPLPMTIASHFSSATSFLNTRGRNHSSLYLRQEAWKNRHLKSRLPNQAHSFSYKFLTELILNFLRNLQAVYRVPLSKESSNKKKIPQRI